MPTWLAQERAAIVAIPSTGTTNETDMPYADDDLGGSPSLKTTEVLKPAAQEEDVLDDSSDHQASDSGTEDDDHFGDSELI